MKKGIAVLLLCCLMMGASALGEQTPFVAQISVEDELSEYSLFYDHIGTLDAIDDLMEEPANCALLLYLNTPGGAMYEIDELYMKLMEYRETTGRPVYAYIAQQAMSGGLYVAMAADRIAASRMSELGSIGVMYSLTSEAGLYEKLGIEEYIVASGKNKAFGWPELTPEQRAFLQANVDEAFDVFVDIICASRGLSREQVLAFSDGRIFSARMAKEFGLIDAVMGYSDAVDDLYARYGLNDEPLVHYPPDPQAEPAEAALAEEEPTPDAPKEVDNLLDWLTDRFAQVPAHGRLAALATAPRRCAVAM